MKPTALFFGSFNPIHRGHLAIARWVAEHGVCDEVWLVVSPGNPLKGAGELADAGVRLEMVRLAVAAAGLGERVKVCDAEFRMPRPSYTIDTLERLGHDFPGRKFALLIGSDIVSQLDKWKDYLKLLDKYQILVYPRPGYPVEGAFAGRVTLLDGAPQWDYSSTRVREAIAGGRAEDMVTPEVLDYIRTHNLWTKSSSSSK